MNLKQKLSKKLKKTGGFTLIEMLIVVAIIAILVAVSIPMVNSNLEKARKATDSANERAAKAAAMAEYMLKGETGAKDYYYDADKGIVVATKPSVNYGQCSNHKGGYIKVSIDANGIATVKWEGTGIGSSEPDGIVSTTATTPAGGSSSSSGS